MVDRDVTLVEILEASERSPFYFKFKFIRYSRGKLNLAKFETKQKTGGKKVKKRLLLRMSPYKPLILLLATSLASPQNLQSVKCVGLALPQVVSSHHQNS